MAPTKTTYFFRIIVLFLSGVALAGVIYMQLYFIWYQNVIMKWKYTIEYALAGVTVFGYLLSFLVRPVGRLRSKIASIIWSTLGGVLGVAWLYTTVTILSLSERQVLPVDYPYTDRDLIQEPHWGWSSYGTANDHNLWTCKSDPQSSLGADVSMSLCHVDRSTASAGALCGLFVLIETLLSYACEQSVRRHSSRHCDHEQQFRSEDEITLGGQHVAPKIEEKK